MVSSNDLNLIVGYKVYLPPLCKFGTISLCFDDAEKKSSEAPGLGDPRAGKPANSPVGAISRRRGPKSPRRFLLFPSKISPQELASTAAGRTDVHVYQDEVEQRLRTGAAFALVLAIHAALIAALLRRLHSMPAALPPQEVNVGLLTLSDRIAAAPAIRANATQKPRTWTARIPRRETPPDPPSATVAGAIDWSAEIVREAAARPPAQTAARALDQHAPGRDLSAGLARSTPSTDFAWDKTHTQRIEMLDGGGALIRLNERCVLLLSPLPMPFCSVGRTQARGDLLDGMQSAGELDRKLDANPNLPP